MEQHVNGWPIIERFLKIRGKYQRDIAQVLKVSPPAVTQFKHGSSLLSPDQLGAITDFLGLDDETLCEFYSSLFNARLGRNRRTPDSARLFSVRFAESRPSAVSGAFPGGRTPIPILTMELIRSYEPALESMTVFARRKAVHCHVPDAGLTGHQLCSILVGEAERGLNLPQGSRITIDCGRYPEHEELVCCSLSDGRILLRKLERHGEQLLFSAVGSSRGSFIWERRESPGLVRWMFPIREIKIPCGFYH